MHRKGETIECQLRLTINIRLRVRKSLFMDGHKLHNLIENNLRQKRALLTAQLAIDIEMIVDKQKMREKEA